jgi:peroxiredoxin Q/BCP
VIAISMDDAATARKFRDSLKAPYRFVADPEAQLVSQYGVKTFLLPIARRVTFVIGPGLKVLHVQEGGDAIDPAGAVGACSLKQPEALRFVTGADGGTTK